MNSTSIFAFLRPKKPSTKNVKHAITTIGSYIDRVIAAVKLTTQLEQTNHTPSQQERDTLNGFFGYGKAASVFEPNHHQHEELKAAFANESRFETARKGVLHSYYTPDVIVDAMWRALCRLGATEGRVLEPACGNGQFIQRAHPIFEGKFVGVELDPTVGNLARLLNPNAKIYTNQRLEHTKLNASGQFDLCIGNPPYGQIKAHDTRYGRVSIHNYFMLRGLSELREGGIMAYVVSSWVMDSKNTEVRKKIASMAELVAAVRLPNTAFKSENVAVITDILFFQKNKHANPEPCWLNTNEHTSGCTINQLFIDHPEYVLGQIEAADSLFDFSSCKVTFQGDFDKELNAVLDQQTTQTRFYNRSPISNIARDVCHITPDEPINYFEIFEQDNDVYQRINDSIDENGFEQPTYQHLSFKNAGQEKRAIAYIAVKDALKELLLAEQSNEKENVISGLRNNLNCLHTAFVGRFGALSRTVNKSLLSQCSMYLRVKALEVDYVAPNKKEDINESFNKAKILSERVFKPFVPVSQANSYEEAISISFNELGELDVSRIAELLGVADDTAIAEMTQKT